MATRRGRVRIDWTCRSLIKWQILRKQRIPRSDRGSREARDLKEGCQDKEEFRLADGGVGRRERDGGMNEEKWWVRRCGIYMYP